jgi:hypothetical protein
MIFSKIVLKAYPRYAFRKEISIPSLVAKSQRTVILPTVFPQKHLSLKRFYFKKNIYSGNCLKVVDLNLNFKFLA